MSMSEKEILRKEKEEGEIQYFVDCCKKWGLVMTVAILLWGLTSYLVVLCSTNSNSLNQLLNTKNMAIAFMIITFRVGYLYVNYVSAVLYERNDVELRCTKMINVFFMIMFACIYFFWIPRIFELTNEYKIILPIYAIACEVFFIELLGLAIAYREDWKKLKFLTVEEVMEERKNKHVQKI